MRLTKPHDNGNGVQGYSVKGKSGAKEYNGWKNRQTWNVSMWLNNDYGLYIALVEFMKVNPDSMNPYKAFIFSQQLADERTPDRIAYISTRLDYDALNDMMRELME
jgi:hypothetical protein